MSILERDLHKRLDAMASSIRIQPDLDAILGQTGMRVIERAEQTRNLPRVVLTIGLAAAALLVVGLVVRQGGSNQNQPSVPSACSNAEAYELRTDHASALPVEHLTASTADSVVWVDNSDGSYLTLTVRPGVAAIQPTPAGIGPMTQDTSFPQDQGQAWFTTTTTTGQLTMWWARTNGDLWLLRGYWYGVNDVDAKATLRERGLAISTSQLDQPYVLADSNMHLLASERAGEVASRAFVWNYADGTNTTQLVLLVIDDSAASGRANLLATGKPEPAVIDGCPAWRTTSANGDVHVGWSTPQDNAWAAFTIPAALAPAADELIAALHGS